MGRDSWTLLCCRRLACFNPRARMGRDSCLFFVHNLKYCFNPRARMGRDTTYRGHHTTVGEFQPTRPHGARPAKPYCGATAPAGFNPRARMGRDNPLVLEIDYMVKFQPTRPHGARPGSGSTAKGRFKFQPTRPHGARRSFLSASCQSLSFNPRARMGRDARRHPGRDRTKEVSTHAPAWGATASGNGQHRRE